MTYLKYHRMNMGKTQAEVAAAAGISQGLYSEYESGHKKPRPHIHRSLAEALHRPVQELTAKLYGVDPKEMVIRVSGKSAR